MEAGAHGITDPDLRSLLGRHWEWTLSRWPELASSIGDRRFDERINDASLEGLEIRRRERVAYLAEARALPRKGLTPFEIETLDMLIGELEADIAVEVCESETWALGVRQNAIASWNRLATRHPVATEKDLRTYLVRVRQAPVRVRQEMDNLRRGLGAGRVTNRESLRRTLEMADAQLAKPPETWPVVTEVADKLTLLPEAERESFRRDLIAATADLVSALRPYRALLADEILPKAREGNRVGLVALPDGDRCYAARILQSLGAPRDPAELHALGETELARIHAEMRVLGKRLFGTDDLPTIFARLRSDPALRFRTAEEVEAKAKSALDAANAKVPQYFGKLPKSPCVIRRIPDYAAPFSTIAYYEPPNPDGSKPGEYFVNVLAPETRPRFEAEVLAYHEAVPGHHLQIAIAYELPLPAIRKYGEYVAYVEGWGLYAERLADEMGLYSGDLDRMGVLSYDSWRAARLVVDTGIHRLGWDRETAEKFMLEQTPLAPNNVTNEVDRYINTPGQALGYKVGQLEILRLREQARKELGDRFSFPGFHDAVLGTGPTTLPVMGAAVRRWVEAARR